MASKKITHNMKFQGKRYVAIRRADWQKLLDLAFPAAGDEVVAAAGGGCGGFCDIECGSNGGCHRSFGSSGSCGAVCGDGSVFIEV